MASLINRARETAGRRVSQTVADRLARWSGDPELRRRVEHIGARIAGERSPQARGGERSSRARGGDWDTPRRPAS